MRGLYHIAGIRRAKVYSPHNEDNDEAIFLEVLKCLEALGHEVRVYDESDLLDDVVEERYIYNMVRSQEAVAKLQVLEQKGVVVVNSGFGIANCGREQMTTLLLDHGVPFAPSEVLDMDGIVNCPCWVKRADGYTVESSDVVFVNEASQLQQVLDGFAQRGIHRVVVSQHLEGDLVKFYGVADTDFFHWFYPLASNHSKFGYEKVNGTPVGIPFSEDRLKDICSQASEVLGVEVYGGDAIVSKDGVVRLIDFNDWPSFAPCREEAAKAITQVIIRKIENYDARR